MYEDLLSQAQQLAEADARKPRQVNLRRAVSAAYYAVFHFLVEECCSPIMGTQHAQQGFRFALGLAFTHSTMKQACSSFAGGTLKSSVAKGLPRGNTGNYTIPSEIKNIASLFVELQEKRHLADYDRSEQFRRSDVLMLIDQTKAQIDRFRQPSASDDQRFFLACLLAWKEMSSR